MLPIVTPAEMARVDACAAVPIETLIERAGSHVARTARRMLGGVYGRRVGVIAGPGNNGADARVAARLLDRWGVNVQLVAPHESLDHGDLIIDGAFGTGVNRRVELAVQPPAVPVLAVDSPSGLDGLTGELHGAVAAAATTVTFGALKPGLLLGPGASLVGEIEIASLGLDLGEVRTWLYTRLDAARDWPARPADHHKWRCAVLVIGGAPTMPGAPELAAAAALRTGAGVVRCLLPGFDVPITSAEVMYERVAMDGWAGRACDDIGRFHAVVLGPGLTVDAQTADQVRAFIGRVRDLVPIVIDGSGLRMLDGVELAPSIVLTPHDGEFEALTGSRPRSDRFGSVQEAASQLNATVLLKGPTTIVAVPNGECMAVTHGDQRLATAGSGDVLSGVVAGLAASGLPSARAAALAAWVHADAARHGPAAGLIASDLVRGLADSVSALAVEQEASNATN